MRRNELVQMKIDSETEGLGYVLAALIEAQPTTVEELTFFLDKIIRDTSEIPNSGPRDIAAREVARSLYRGVEAFKYREAADPDEWY